MNSGAKARAAGKSTMGSPKGKTRPRPLRATRNGLAKLVKQKKLADKSKNRTIVNFCATRTVEYPSTGEVGKEKNKLLFMMALGLIPKIDLKVLQPSLTVKVAKLDPLMAAECKSVTQNRINQLILQQQLQKELELNQLPKSPEICPEVPSYLDPVTGTLVPLQFLPEVETPRVSPENVELITLDGEEEPEIIDLVEDDDSDVEILTDSSDSGFPLSPAPSPLEQRQGVFSFDKVTLQNLNRKMERSLEMGSISMTPPPESGPSAGFKLRSAGKKK